jgi:hypothetical protein
MGKEEHTDVTCQEAAAAVAVDMVLMASMTGTTCSRYIPAQYTIAQCTV